MKAKKEESEFGSGLIICLTKFSEHFWTRTVDRIQSVQTWITRGMPENETMFGHPYTEDVAMFKNIELSVHKDPQKALASMIETWANGATDHLYGLKVPKTWSKTYIAKLIRELRHKGLTMGHGFTGKLWTIEDFNELQTLTRRIALLIDKKIGVEDGDEGQW